MPLIRALRSTNWPATCQVCGRWPSAPVCAACAARFAPPWPRCARCGARHGAPNPSSDSPCGCAKTLGALEHCVVAVDYAYPWDRLIARFKFQAEVGWARVFADLMAQAPGAATLLRQADLITPIPLTAQRIAQRGHHPPWALVKALPHSRALPTHPSLLMRTRDVADQHSLPRARRWRNLQGVMSVPIAHHATLQGKHIVLVDDVTTTGATLHWAAQALRAAGAARVDAMVFAHTPAVRDAPL